MTRDIAKFVPLQVPKYIRETYPQFILFVQAYYEWLMLPENAGWATLKLQDIRDIDRTTDVFIQWFRETYLADFPANAFVQTEHHELNYIAKVALENALSLSCVCSGVSVPYTLPPAIKTRVDIYNLEKFRTVKWVIHVRDKLDNVTAYQLISTVTENGEVDYVVYGILGEDIPHEIQITVDSQDNVEFFITNNSAYGDILVNILREPVLVNEKIVGVQRTYIVDKRITNQSVVVVYVNDVAVPNDQITIGPEISYCNSYMREVTINAPYPIEVGDSVRIEIDTSSNADERLLIKNIRQIYAQKGTEASIRLMFNLLYGEQIEIDYPGKRVLRSSDGKWDDDRTTIRILNNNGEAQKLLFRQVEFQIWNELAAEGPRYDTIGIAAVEEFIEVDEGGVKMADLQLSNIKLFGDEGIGIYQGLAQVDGSPGTFVPKQKIYANYVDHISGQTTQVDALIVPAAYNIESLNGAGGYFKDDSVVVANDGSEFDYRISIRYKNDTVSIIPHYFGTLTTTDAAQNYRVYHRIRSVSPEVVVESPAYLRIVGDNIEILDHSQFSFDDYIEFGVRARGLGAIISEVDSFGVIQNVNIYTHGIGFIETTRFATNTTELVGSPPVEVARSASPEALLSTTKNTIKQFGGYYVNYDGMISSYPVLQDGRFYNPYTYVIKSSRALVEYKNVLIDLVHPAGFGIWGQMQLYQCLHLFVKSVTVLVETAPTKIHSQSSRYCGSTYMSFDGRKISYDRVSIDYGVDSPSTVVPDNLTGNSFFDPLSTGTTIPVDIDTTSAAQTPVRYFLDLTLRPFVETPHASFRVLPDSEINQYNT